jgi:hypothetical protein
MPQSAPFTPGLGLSRAFYEEVARPLVEGVVGPAGYAAALVGSGSDVLGYDSPRSTDHDWGPRFQVFLPAEGFSRAAAALDAALAEGLPETFRDFPVRSPAGDDPGAPARHMVEITTVRDFAARYLCVDVTGPLALRDWLTFPEQRLLELTSGELFHDPRGDLSGLRALLSAYPRDVWLYRMACQWQRISRHDAFVGRCAEAGDTLGMRLAAARIVRDAARLCFLVERTYAPYDKWLGSAFARLRCGPALCGRMIGVLEGGSYAALEENLLPLYQALGAMHNALGVTPPLDLAPRPAHGRPWHVIGAERFTNALLASIEDGEIRGISPRIGAIDQYSDSTDLIENVAMYRKTLGLYS